MMKKSALLAAILMSLAGVAQADATADAIADAEAKNKVAAKAGGEWRDTEEHIKKAQEAASKGDNETAMKLAKKAAFEAEAGTAQAKAETKAKPWLF